MAENNLRLKSDDFKRLWKTALLLRMAPFRTFEKFDIPFHDRDTFLTLDRDTQRELFKLITSSYISLYFVIEQLLTWKRKCTRVTMSGLGRITCCENTSIPFSVFCKSCTPPVSYTNNRDELKCYCYSDHCNYNDQQYSYNTGRRCSYHNCKCSYNIRWCGYRDCIMVTLRSLIKNDRLLFVPYNTETNIYIEINTNFIVKIELNNYKVVSILNSENNIVNMTDDQKYYALEIGLIRQRDLWQYKVTQKKIPTANTDTDTNIHQSTTNNDTHQWINTHQLSANIDNYWPWSILESIKSATQLNICMIS